MMTEDLAARLAKIRAGLTDFMVAPSPPTPPPAPPLPPSLAEDLSARLQALLTAVSKPEVLRGLAFLALLFVIALALTVARFRRGPPGTPVGQTPTTSNRHPPVAPGPATETRGPADYPPSTRSPGSLQLNLTPEAMAALAAAPTRAPAQNLNVTLMGPAVEGLRSRRPHATSPDATTATAAAPAAAAGDPPSSKGWKPLRQVLGKGSRTDRVSAREEPSGEASVNGGTSDASVPGHASPRFVQGLGIVVSGPSPSRLKAHQASKK
ncbi:hypothetical protein H696_00895 [Fonticula alba]|uniref:Uncharacterized protein n=1 Tax=Fonticula alba TaxID=691883 RepID=A0A058ZHB6_FONAL|nr:hypothetical protein H696_00895 [Fonticula alba]KCV73356.1 hypothetical protein H696_00895 [Fonticula alba]|eukprot:XP_009493057.1 hypothetical protein H696_00895 [Fonticula alba]